MNDIYVVSKRIIICFMLKFVIWDSIECYASRSLYEFIC